MKNSVFKLTIACLAASVCHVQAQSLDTPMAGLVVTGDGQLMKVHGIFGSLLPGAPMTDWTEGPVLGAFFTGVGGAVKTGEKVVRLDATGAFVSSLTAPKGPALFGFAPDGTLAWMYFESESYVQSATGNTVWNTLHLGDAVVALGSSASLALPILVRSHDQLWAEQVNSTTGAILARQPLEGTAPAVWFENGWLVTGGPGAFWYPAGSTVAQAIQLPEGVQTLQVSGAHSVALNGGWLLNAQFQTVQIPMHTRTVHHKAAQRSGVERNGVPQ